MSSFNTTIYCVPLKYSMFNPIISLYCLLFALVLLDSYTTNHLFQLPFCMLRTFLYIIRIYDKMMTKTFLQVDESAVTLFFFVAVFFSQLWFKNCKACLRLQERKSSFSDTNAKSLAKSYLILQFLKDFHWNNLKILSRITYIASTINYNSKLNFSTFIKIDDVSVVQTWFSSFLLTIHTFTAILLFKQTIFSKKNNILFDVIWDQNNPLPIHYYLQSFVKLSTLINRAKSPIYTSFVPQQSQNCLIHCIVQTQ